MFPAGSLSHSLLAPGRDPDPAGSRVDSPSASALGRGRVAEERPFAIGGPGAVRESEGPGGEKAQLDELKALAEVRSRTWWLLSRFFLERPEPAFLAELGAAFGSPPASEVAVNPDVDALVAYLREATPEDLGRRLAPEFTRLLRGIQEGSGPPPPYESLYRGQSVGGDLTLAVLNRYRAAGFGEVEPSVGPQDHLGAELRFLALLALGEGEAWGSGETEVALTRIVQQQGFLDAHLLTWLPTYAARLEAEAREVFYGAAARLTLAFARETRADLDLIEADLEAA